MKLSCLFSQQFHSIVCRQAIHFKNILVLLYHVKGLCADRTRATEDADLLFHDVYIYKSNKPSGN